MMDDRPKVKESLRKIFVGGLNRKTDEGSLSNYFGRFGEVVDCVVIRDKDDRSKGFGFVIFKDAESVDEVQKNENGHFIDNKEVETRRAVQRKGKQEKETINVEANYPTKKIFLGGIKYDVEEQDLMEYFSRYAGVKSAEVIRDKEGKSRGFAYVVLDSQDAADKVCIEKDHIIKGRECEAKKSLSKNELMRHKDHDGSNRGGNYDNGNSQNQQQNWNQAPPPNANQGQNAGNWNQGQNQGQGPPGNWSQGGNPPGNWYGGQYGPSGGNWNQGAWNQGAPAGGNWNQSGPWNWNQGPPASGNWNQGSWNWNQGGPGNWQGSWNQGGGQNQSAQDQSSVPPADGSTPAAQPPPTDQNANKPPGQWNQGQWSQGSGPGWQGPWGNWAPGNQQGNWGNGPWGGWNQGNWGGPPGGNWNQSGPAGNWNQPGGNQGGGANQWSSSGPQANANQPNSGPPPAGQGNWNQGQAQGGNWNQGPGGNWSQGNWNQAPPVNRGGPNGPGPGPGPQGAPSSWNQGGDQKPAEGGYSQPQQQPAQKESYGDQSSGGGGPLRVKQERTHRTAGPYSTDYGRPSSN